MDLEFVKETEEKPQLKERDLNGWEDVVFELGDEPAADPKD